MVLDIKIKARFLRKKAKRNKEKHEDLKYLKEENEAIRNSIDNCLPIDEAENKDCWEKINQLINNEIEQEGLCNK